MLSSSGLQIILSRSNLTILFFNKPIECNSVFPSKKQKLFYSIHKMPLINYYRVIHIKYCFASI